MAVQPDDDPLLELRDSLEDGDEPLFAPPPPPRPAAATPSKGVARAPVPVARPTARFGQAAASAPSAASTAPPPLPPGKKPMPSAAANTRPPPGRPPPPNVEVPSLPQTVVRPPQG